MEWVGCRQDSQLSTHATWGRPRADIRSHRDGLDLAMTGNLLVYYWVVNPTLLIHETALGIYIPQQSQTPPSRRKSSPKTRHSRHSRRWCTRLMRWGCTLQRGNWSKGLESWVWVSVFNAVMIEGGFADVQAVCVSGLMYSVHTVCGGFGGDGFGRESLKFGGRKGGWHGWVVVSWSVVMMMKCEEYLRCVG